MDYLKQRIPIYREAYKVEFWVWLSCTTVIVGLGIWMLFIGEYSRVAIDFALAAVTLHCAFDAKRKLGTVDMIESLVKLVEMKDETISILEKTVSLSGETKEIMAKLIDKMKEHIDLLTESRDTQYDLIKMFVAAEENPDKIERETQITELITHTKSYIAMVEEFKAQQGKEKDNESNN